MNHDWLLPLIFFPAFIALWTGVIFFIATIGGWRSLAKLYATDAAFDGTRWRMQTGVMRGLARYNHILTIGASPRGLYLAVMVLFRTGHPPLFIPWEHIDIREHESWILRSVMFTFRSAPGVYLKVSRNLGEQVARAGGRQIARAG